MRVTSPAGTDLDRQARGRARRRRVGLHGEAGHASRTGPAGSASRSPRRQRQRHAGAGAGRRQSDLQALPARRRSRSRIENDYVRAIEGDGLDADLMREYFAAWGDARRLRGLARRLGHEPGGALGRDGVLRQARLQRHRAARVRRQLPVLDRRERGRRAGTRSATSTCRCATARSRSTARRSSSAGRLLRAARVSAAGLPRSARPRARWANAVVPWTSPRSASRLSVEQSRVAPPPV